MLSTENLKLLVSMSQECAVLVRLQQVLLICILNNKIKKKKNNNKGSAYHRRKPVWEPSQKLVGSEGERLKHSIHTSAGAWALV